MPRRATGRVEHHEWKDGRTVSWRLRVDEFRDWLLERPAQNRKNGEALSPRSVNMVLAFLAQVLDLAIDHKKLAGPNPARGERRV